MDSSNGFYGGPPLMNPPRIFGSMSAHGGSPMPASMAASMFHPDDMDDGHEQGDPKRRRIARVRRRRAAWACSEC